MITKKPADFIIAVTGNRIEEELRGVQDLSLTPRFEASKVQDYRLAPVPRNSDYKENPKGIRSNLF